MSNVATSSEINHISACAGVGGLDLALSLVYGARLRTRIFIEREVFAVSTLVARMEDQTLPEAAIWDSVETFDGKPWRDRFEIFSAGFPCPPFSVAGKGLGLKDPRWIWPSLIRIIREIRPAVVYLENVSGLLGFPDAVGRIFGDLAESGYDAEWDMFSAASVGASHKRERVFILAYARRLAEPGIESPLHLRRSDYRPATETGSAELVHSIRARRSPTNGYDLDTTQQPTTAGSELGNTESNDQRRDTYRAHGQRIATGRSSGTLADTGSRLLQKPRRGADRRDGIRSAGEDLADAELQSGCAEHEHESRRQSTPRKRDRSELVEGSAVDVDDSKGRGQSERRQSPARKRGRRHVDGAGETLDDAEVERKRAVAKERRESGEPIDAHRSGNGIDVGNASSERRQGRERREPPRDAGSTASGSTGKSSLPLFPPGPGARDEWQRILEIDPTLEPSVCRIVNELSKELDQLAPRTDRLRAMGNAVVPTCAAISFIVLMHRAGLVR